MSKVLVVVPMYDGWIKFRTADTLYTRSTRNHQGRILGQQSSLLPHNCTKGWMTGLELRDADPAYEWLAMLHDDIEPADWWLDTLIELAERHGADLMSAVSPIKNDAGAVSTALLWADGRQGNLRLTTGQVNHPDFPATFGPREAAEALARLPEPFRVGGVSGHLLLANTGCMVCRLNRPWCDQVWFDWRTIMKRIDGRRAMVTLSEDWYFTQAVQQAGGKVMATREVTLIHYGESSFRSDTVWGQPRILQEE